MRENGDSREIDGNTWTVELFPATEGLRILTKLLKLIGEPVGTAVGSLNGESLMAAKINFELIGKAVGQLVQRFDEDHIVALVKRMVKDVRCDGKEVYPQFDMVFMGRYVVLAKVLLFVVEANYKLPLNDLLASHLQKETGSQDQIPGSS